MYVLQVYTINQESKNLLVMGIPAIRVREELIKLFALYGDVEEYVSIRSIGKRQSLLMSSCC
jgi:hypothetical protein